MTYRTVDRTSPSGVINHCVATSRIANSEEEDRSDRKSTIASIVRETMPTMEMIPITLSNPPRKLFHDEYEFSGPLKHTMARVNSRNRVV